MFPSLNNMKIILMLCFLFFSTQAYSSDWSLESLDALKSGCLEGQKNRSMKESYKWCACTTFRTYQYFSLQEIISLANDGKLRSNKKYKKVLSECD